MTEQNENADELYAIWLQLACGICNRVYRTLFTRFSSCREIYECEQFSFLNGTYECERSLRNKELTEAYELQKRCRGLQIGILTYYDPRYPDRLRLIDAPPAVLYYIGNLRDLNAMVGVGVVGTRKCSEYGSRVADDFAFDLTMCGATVISGLAQGIDTCAHRGAVRARGYTVAVLGTAINEIYPPCNTAAFHTLYERGLVISEMYPGCKSYRSSFPNRNRLISGLAEAVLIVEAGEKSGALITARHAIRQNKLLYAIPGALGDTAAGTNQLIKDGVKAATNALDILSELAMSHPTAIHPENILATPRIYAYGNGAYRSRESAYETLPVKPKKPAPVRSPEEKRPTVPEQTASERICDALADGILSSDELAQKTGLSIDVLLGTLTELEILGKVRSLAGNRYKQIKSK